MKKAMRRAIWRGAFLAAVVTASGAPGLAMATSINTAVPAPHIDEKSGPAATETAVFAGGCFWGMQAVFEHVNGVRRVVAGYAGGAKATANYELVSTELTGHAESVQIAFDPSRVSFGTLMRIYFSVAHDPTELDRQDPDVGSSYRSEIFAASPQQLRVARAYIAQLGKAHVFDAPIVTRTEPLKGFYPAEGYHQDFLIKNPYYPYIVFNDMPKLTALKHVFPALYRENPAMLAATGP